VAYFVFVYAVSHLETVFAFLMMDQFGYDALHVAGILVLMGVIMAGIQGGAIRPLARRFGERRLWIAGTLLLAPCLAVVPFIHSIWILLLPLAASSSPPVAFMQEVVHLPQGEKHLRKRRGKPLT